MFTVKLMTGDLVAIEPETFSVTHVQQAIRQRLNLTRFHRFKLIPYIPNDDMYEDNKNDSNQSCDSNDAIKANDFVALLIVPPSELIDKVLQDFRTCLDKTSFTSPLVDYDPMSAETELEFFKWECALSTVSTFAKSSFEHLKTDYSHIQPVQLGRDVAATTANFERIWNKFVPFVWTYIFHRMNRMNRMNSNNANDTNDTYDTNLLDALVTFRDDLRLIGWNNFRRIYSDRVLF